MALVNQGYWGWVTLADTGGQRTTLHYQLRGADEIGAASNMTAIRAALTNISDSVEIAYGLGYRYEEDSIAYPAGNVQNENKLSCTVTLAGGAKRANFKVPAPKVGCFVAASGPGNNECNVAAGIVTAYYALFTLAGACFISDGEDATVLESGKRIHAKSNKG